MKFFLIDLERAQTIYKPIIEKAHKGTQGHALLIGGSYGKMGAMVLAAKSSLKSGCGLVTVFVPKCGYEIIQISFPEAMVITDENEKNISKIEFKIEPSAIGIGMGIGQEIITQNAFYTFLKNNNTTLLLDADALNMLSKNKEWLPLLPKNTILTPHQKELERLIGSWKNDHSKLKLAAKFALENQLIIVIKDHQTIITDGKNFFKNSTGNSGLATAGSGDSLSGIIVSLIAQNYKPLEACLLGTYIHGLTADIGTITTGYESFIASNIHENLGKAFLTLSQ